MSGIPPRKITITAISDTHNEPLFQVLMGMQPTDFLIHVGDLTNHGTRTELMKFKTDLKKIKEFYKTILYTGGNHDGELETDKSIREEIYAETGAIFLDHEAVTINGVKFFGSPYTPRYGGIYTAWQYPRDSTNRWETIPDDVDVLLTHCPPHGFLDWQGDTNMGCWLLLQSIMVKKPKIHLFGHCHEQGHRVFATRETKFYNVAIAGRNPPSEIEYEIPT